MIKIVPELPQESLNLESTSLKCPALPLIIPQKNLQSTRWPTPPNNPSHLVPDTSKKVVSFEHNNVLDVSVLVLPTISVPDAKDVTSLKLTAVPENDEPELQDMLLARPPDVSLHDVPSVPSPQLPECHGPEVMLVPEPTMSVPGMTRPRKLIQGKLQFTKLTLPHNQIMLKSPSNHDRAEDRWTYENLSQNSQPKQALPKCPKSTKKEQNIPPKMSQIRLKTKEIILERKKNLNIQNSAKIRTKSKTLSVNRLKSTKPDKLFTTPVKCVKSEMTERKQEETSTPLP